MRRLLAAALLAAAACSKAPDPPAAPDAPAPTGRAVLFLGDSLTAGYGVPAAAAYPSLLAERWRAAGRPLLVRNAGVSGSTTAGVLENLDWNLQDDVAVVFLAIGANDGLRGRDLRETERDLTAIVERIQERGARVVLAGMKMPPNYGPDYTRGFAAMFPRVAERAGVPLLPFLLEGVAGRPAYNIADGIHPNEKGHRIMADRVAEFLEKRELLPS